MSSEETGRGATIHQLRPRTAERPGAPDADVVTRQVHTLLKLMVELITLLERELDSVAELRLRPVQRELLAEGGAAEAAIAAATDGLARIREALRSIAPTADISGFPGEQSIQALGEVLRHLDSALIEEGLAPRDRETP
jgi:hypothetical protein